VYQQCDIQGTAGESGGNARGERKKKVGRENERWGVRGERPDMINGMGRGETGKEGQKVGNRGWKTSMRGRIQKVGFVTTYRI
jgi:hypothetical protein